MRFNAQKNIGKEKRKVLIVAVVAAALFCALLFVNVFTNMSNKSYNKGGFVDVWVYKDKVEKGIMLGEHIQKISIPENSTIPKEALNLDEISIKKMYTNHPVVVNEMVLSSNIVDGNIDNIKDEKLDFSRLLQQTFAPGSIPSVVTDGSIIDIVEVVAGNSDNTIVSKAVVYKKVNETTLELFLNPDERERLKEKSLSNANLIITVYKSDIQPATPIK